MLTSYQLQSSKLNMAQLAECNREYGHVATSVARGKFLGNTDAIVIIDNGEVTEKPKKAKRKKK